MMIYKLLLILSGILILFCGCFESSLVEEDVEKVIDSREPDYDPYSLITTDMYDPVAISIGTVAQNEISGISLSKDCDQVIWAINDNDNGPYLYQLDTETAEIKLVYHLQNMRNVDWEAISLGKGIYGYSNLYIGDIGNNNLKRTKIWVYRFEEPNCFSEAGDKISLTPEFDQLEFVYPDGPHDAEAMYVDDVTLDIYIITKTKSRSGVYLFPYPQSLDQTDTLTYLGSLPFQLTVSADYSPEVKILLVKTYDQIYLWENNEDKKLTELIFDIPMKAPYNPIELQGESICIGSSGYYTLSEKVFGIEPVLYRYNRKMISDE